MMITDLGFTEGAVAFFCVDERLQCINRKMCVFDQLLRKNDLKLCCRNDV